MLGHITENLTESKCVGMFLESSFPKAVEVMIDDSDPSEGGREGRPFTSCCFSLSLSLEFIFIQIYIFFCIFAFFFFWFSIRLC